MASRRLALMSRETGDELGYVTLTRCARGGGENCWRGERGISRDKTRRAIPRANPLSNSENFIFFSAANSDLNVRSPGKIKFFVMLETFLGGWLDVIGKISETRSTRKVEIGTDGIWMKRWNVRRKFFPKRDLKENRGSLREESSGNWSKWDSNKKFRRLEKNFKLAV